MRGIPAARCLLGGLFLSAALLGAGCAPLQSERLRASAAAFPEPIELREVPFFPQEQYQCGPAALATLLNFNGLAVTPEQLAPQVYLPQRQGSLQLELVAAARRHGFIPYILQPQLESLTAEIASGHPVLVLQNLGLSFAPTWHYAVAVGFDLTKGEMVLRSGREPRRVTALETFEHTWRRGDYWSMVVLPADELPFTAEELPYLQSVTALEQLGQSGVATVAYQTALTRWPQSLGAWIGLGNSRYALGDLAGAEQAFRRALTFHPSSALAHNNLAQALADQKRYDEAETSARRAVELGVNGPVIESLQRTLNDILQRKTAP